MFCAYPYKKLSLIFIFPLNVYNIVYNVYQLSDDMDTEKVLVALKEKKRWEVRQRQLEEELEKIKVKKEQVLTELNEIKHLVARYQDLVVSMGEEKKSSTLSEIQRSKCI